MKSSETDTTFEPFTNNEPSPNPDYPQDIEVINGNVKIINCGKNLITKQGFSTPLNEPDYYGANTTYLTPLSDGWGHLECDNSSGSNTMHINFFIKINNIHVKPNTQYTIFSEIRNGSLARSITLNQNVDKDLFKESKGIGTVQANAGGIFKTLVTTKDVLTNDMNLRCYSSVYSGEKSSFDIRMMILEGNWTDKEVEYEQYKSNEHTIDLQDNELVKLTDDIKDTIEIDKNRNVSLNKRIGKAVLDENTNPTIASRNYPNLFFFSLSALGMNVNSLKAISDYFTFVDDTRITDNASANTYLEYGQFAFRHGTVDRIYFKIENITTGTDFKTWLSENNVTVYYELAEPTTSSLGKIDDFVAFKGNSTLFIETNIEPSYQLCRYYKDSILTNYFPTKNEVETKFEITNGKIESSINEIKNLIKYVSNSGSLTIENASENNLSLLSIKGDISLLFGNDGKTYGDNVPLAEPLYPSPNLFGKNMNLIVENGENEKQTYKLPFSYLNYISQEVADEFVLENGKAKIIRRVGINSSMKKYELSEEVIEELGELVINLKEGTNKVYLQCFDSSIYTAGYMEKNDYTEQFATKVELNSSITQLSNEINLEVNGKIEGIDKDLNAKLELKVDTEKLISEINASADVIRLDSNRFSMTSDYSSITEDGEATFKKADIGGFITDETSFSKDLNGIYDYSEFDLQFLRYVLLEYININNDTSTKNILDVINDGELNSADLLAIREIIQGLRTNNKVVQGSFYINSNNPKNCFVIKDNSGDVVVSLGLGGVNSNQVVTQNIVCANTKTTDTSLNKYVTINGIDGNIKASGKVEATTITQTSIAEKKKNFELYQDALSEIAKIDIYKYNLVDEQDGDKKHIGFVIGNEFNYSEEITNQENNQVDLYSMISMCMQGLKQQQEIIKKLEKRIEVLENENIGKN